MLSTSAGVARPERRPLVSYREVIQKELKVMDSTAFTMCKDNAMPIVVFDLTFAGNVLRHRVLLNYDVPHVVAGHIVTIVGEVGARSPFARNMLAPAAIGQPPRLVSWG